jgi:hypothetical protein
MRCKKCVTPDCVPGSEFDKDGVCSWCRTGHPNYKPLGIDVLGKRLREGLRTGTEVDCIVGVSGGKDSAFALWVMKKHFGLRVEAFTYDHSGVTEPARANARAVCDTLEVPLTVCAFPDDEHRKSFVHYLDAFTNRETLVCAGLTCVACKHLHLFGTELAAERKAPFMVWAKCPLEDPPFLALKSKQNSTSREGLAKGGFLLASEVLQSKTLFGAVVRHFPVTLKGCLAFSPTSSYMKLRYPSVQQIPLFEYWPWNPKEIYATLINAGWKKPTNVPSDWHSDCSFHVFKEYMFQKMLGATYTDGFLSNQIRAGIITRADALHDLAVSKQHFAQQLPHAIKELGLEYLGDKIDPACFNIFEIGEFNEPVLIDDSSVIGSVA